MDEFKPEDELKPDTSDRRPQRQQRSPRLSASQLALSRQHLMIGIGIVMLVLLITGVGFALQLPSKQADGAQTASAGNGEKSIDLSSSSSMRQGAPTQAEVASGNAVVSGNVTAPGQSQTLNAPLISSSPTQAQVTPPPAGQHRVELPGNMTDALSTQQEKVNAFSQGATSGSAPVTTLPTTLATEAPSEKNPSHVSEKGGQEKAAHPKNVQDKAVQSKLALTPAKKVRMTSGKPTFSGDKATVSGKGKSIQNASASHFTLQLSSASRSETLKAYAKQHNLPNALVYETKRDGKPWYVLVNGVYASSAQAKQVVSSLPAAVQAKKPWVKPIRQVKQELNK
ncbi:MAG: SPOR domain-containing protein [Candidatus Malihini olakiniferum]